MALFGIRGARIMAVMMLVYPLGLPASASDQWVEVEGAAEIAGNLSADEAYRMAVDRARERAVELVTGTEISSFGGSSRHDEKLTTFSAIETRTWGKVIDYSTISRKVDHSQSDSFRPIPIYRVRVRALVRPDGPGEASFKVNLSASSQQIRVGEPITFQVRPTKAAWIWLFSLGADDRVRQLVPNEMHREATASANAEISFPRAFDVYQFKPAPVSGHSQDTEAVKAVAMTIQVPPPPIDQDGATSLEGFYRWLLEIPPGARSEASAIFTVFANDHSLEQRK